MLSTVATTTALVAKASVGFECRLTFQINAANIKNKKTTKTNANTTELRTAKMYNNKNKYKTTYQQQQRGSSPVGGYVITFRM